MTYVCHLQGGVEQVASFREHGFSQLRGDGAAFQGGRFCDLLVGDTAPRAAIQGFLGRSNAACSLERLNLRNSIDRRCQQGTLRVTNALLSWSYWK